CLFLKRAKVVEKSFVAHYERKLRYVSIVPVFQLRAKRAKFCNTSARLKKRHRIFQKPNL
ncbi:MAG: hypothetical protein J7J91_01935, partial [Deltaproteobacteria bacterium]|nr:hypothetical protein [Deltaproteobacteria bacterium]